MTAEAMIGEEKSQPAGWLPNRLKRDLNQEIRLFLANRSRVSPKIPKVIVEGSGIKVIAKF